MMVSFLFAVTPREKVTQTAPQLVAVSVTVMNAGPSPTNSVFGPCGESYMYIYEAPGVGYFFVTGFRLNRPAIGYSWNADVRGEYDSGVDYFDWSQAGPLAFRTEWTSGAVYSSQDSPNGTYYLARVTSGVAFMADGGLCWAGYPNDGRKLQK